MFKTNLRLEALSSIVGVPIESHANGNYSTEELNLDLFVFHEFSLIYSNPKPLASSGGKKQVSFNDFSGRHFNINLDEETDVKCLTSRLQLFFSIKAPDIQVLSATIGSVTQDIKLDGSQYYVTGNAMFVDEDSFFDPRYDFDFTHIKDSRKFERGGEEYVRPCGWIRFALKVLGKYEDDKWLGASKTGYRQGSIKGEWPVSYHGTSKQGSDGIIQGEYLAGPRALFGTGVYSTPDIEIASKYAKIFTASSGKKYKVVLQNRVNPKYRQIIPKDKTRVGEYWLIPSEVPIKDAIRPYGVLLKEAV